VTIPGVGGTPASTTTYTCKNGECAIFIGK
jgi:hypothetical protein